jgi:hypothetical protein
MHNGNVANAETTRSQFAASRFESHARAAPN